MARGILITELLRAQDFRIEVRTSDPASPADGRCWVRSDLDAEADKAGEFRFSLGGQTYSVWMMEPTTTPSGVEEYLRIETGSGIKVLPLSPRTDAVQPEISVQTPSGIYGAWSPPQLTVNTLSEHNVQSDQAELNGDLAELINADSADAYFEWRQDGTSSWNTTPIENLDSPATWNTIISNLQSDTQYEFRATADSVGPSGYSDDGSIEHFTTSAAVISNISSIIFTLDATQTFDGESGSQNSWPVVYGDASYDLGTGGSPDVDNWIYDNTKEVLNFNGSSDWLSNNNVPDISPPFTMYAVVDANFSSSESSYQSIVHRTDGSEPQTYLQWDSGGNWQFRVDGNPTTGSTDTSVNIFCCQITSGGTQRLYEDGNLVSSISNNTNIGFSDMTIGAFEEGAGDHFDGSIAYIEIHDGEPSTSRSQRESEIMEYFGI